MNFFGGRKLVFLRLVDLLDFHENWPECSSDISCGQALGRMTLTFSEMLGLHPMKLAVACKHSKPITWRVLASNYQTRPREPENYLRTISVCDNGIRCETLEMQRS